MNMEQAQLGVLAVLAVALLAEILAGRHRRLYNRNDYVVNGLCLLLAFTLRPLVALSAALAIAFVLPRHQGTLEAIPFWFALSGIILIAEFTNYWVHRWSHEPHKGTLRRWLWPLHRTHHTGGYANVLLHFRLNLFWGLVSPLAWVHTLAIYLGLMAPAIVSVTIFSLWGVFTHSNFRWDDVVRRHKLMGPAFRAMEHLVVTPGIHHTHHGFGRDGKSHRNFGLLLSVFDWAFGTLHIPKGRPARYGVPGPSPFWAEELFYPLYQHRFFVRKLVNKHNPGNVGSKDKVQIG